MHNCTHVLDIDTYAIFLLVGSSWFLCCFFPRGDKAIILGPADGAYAGDHPRHEPVALSGSL